MSPTTRVRVTFNLGAGAAISTVAAALDDLNTVCQFGSELQDISARNRALREVLAGDAPWLRDYDRYNLPPRGRSVYYWLFEPLASPGLEQAVASYMRELDIDSDGEVFVERLTYANPVDAILVTAAGSVVVALLAIFRDWGSRRRVGNAKARIAEAQAADFEDQVAVRKELRRFVRERLLTGELPLRPEQIDGLLSPAVLDAGLRLANAGLELEEGRDDEADG